MTGRTTTMGMGMGHKVRQTSWLRGAVAVAAALAVVGALPVRADAAPGDGVPVYKTEGDPVKGTVSSGQAPTLKPGIFTDTIGVGEKKYYGVDLDDVSSAFISGFALPKPGTKVAYNDGVNVELESSSGTDCNSGSDHTFGADNAARPIGGYASRKISRDLECQEKGHYLFSVERVSDGTSDPDPWPVEIRYMLEPALKKGTVPKRFAPAPSTTPAPPTGAAKQVKGGTGFNDAAAVDDGVWKDRIVPGQLTWYRVPVEWGQQLFATAEFANAENVTDEDGYTTDGVAVGVYNTARGDVADDSALYDGDQVAAEVLTQRADYTNRFESDDALSAMRFAGWYYIVVGMHPAVGEFVDGGVDVTLRVKLEGQPEQGPEYDGDAVKAGFGISEDAFDGGAGTDSDNKKLVAYGAFGVGGVLVVGLLAWLLVARGRRPVDAVPAGPAGPAGHPGYGNGTGTGTGSGGYGDPHGGGGSGAGTPPPPAW